MKKVLAGALVALAAVLVFRSCSQTKDKERVLKENTMLIQQQLQNVAKLIVTEGHFAEVYNYADSKALFGPLVTADKKALVVVNAEVSIVYDLKSLKFDVDSVQKVLSIQSIPKPEININPDFEYYDVRADYFNPFNAADYNLIKKNVKASLLKKVKASSLVSNAKNRLLTELSGILVLTNSMGWTLVYKDAPITNEKELRLLRFPSASQP